MKHDYDYKQYVSTGDNFINYDSSGSSSSSDSLESSESSESPMTVSSAFTEWNFHNNDGGDVVAMPDLDWLLQDEFPCDKDLSAIPQDSKVS